MIRLPESEISAVPLDRPSVTLARPEGKLGTSPLSVGITYKYRTSRGWFLASTSNQEDHNGWGVGFEWK